MGKINVDYDVLNQKGSPAWYSDLFANIPTPGYTGRMFISTDTFAFYRDNGTGWDLTGGPGIGTITGSGVSGQVSFFSGTQVLGGSTNLIWDNTNNRLGIGVASPTVTLEISGSVKATALVKSGGTSAQILLADGTTTPTSTFQAAITLTTTGTTGASTLVGATLNVPTYTFVSSVSALTLGTSGTDLTSSVANSTTTPVITLNVPTASASNRGALSSADWTTFNNKQATITLTTTGTSGAATLVGATLNVPNYTNVGTVTSVAALTLGTSGTDLSSSVANSTSTPVITLNVPTASATNRGALSSADWTTFNNKQATISVTAPVVLTGATISMPAATTSVNGYLTSTDWNTFNNKSNTNGTVTSVVALTIGTTGIDITSTAVTTTTTPVITLNIPTASASNRGALSSTDWTIFNNKQATLSLTTTGTSGAATLVANTLNVPNYTNSATVTSVGLSSATSGVTIGSTPITTSGTITIAIATATTSQNGLLSSTDWNTFNNKQATLSLTTTGTSGAATLVANTLNVPNYGSALSGYLPLTGGTLTGSLGGTSATFSGNVISNSAFIVDQASGNDQVIFKNNGSFDWQIGGKTGDATQNFSIYNYATATRALFFDKSSNAATFTGKVFLNTTTAYTSELNVQSIAANRPAIKAGYGIVSGNGYWILGDNYTTDESLMAIGIDYSSGGLVMGSILAPSTTTQGGFISTQAQFGGYGAAIRLGTSGEIIFYNGNQNTIIATGSTKTAVISLTIAQTGAATFSSSVTATDLVINTATNQGGAFINGNVDNVWLKINNTATGGQSWNIGATGGTSGLGQGKLIFKVGGTETAYNIPLTLTTDNSSNGGRVGIGTTLPGNQLSVRSEASSGIATIDVRGGSGGAGGIQISGNLTTLGTTSFDLIQNSAGAFVYQRDANSLTFGTNNTSRYAITSAGINNYTSRGNYLGATDNALFSLNSGGTLYTVGFSPTATASSTNTFTITNGTTTWIYTGSGAATWTLPNPSGNNQIYWIKNAGTGAITLTAFSGTNIIDNSAASVGTISIAVGATAVIAQDGNVKSYQLQ